MISYWIITAIIAAVRIANMENATVPKIVLTLLAIAIWPIILLASSIVYALGETNE